MRVWAYSYASDWVPVVSCNEPSGFIKGGVVYCYSYFYREYSLIGDWARLEFVQNKTNELIETVQGAGNFPRNRALAFRSI
jgi:hypothetical protein